MSRKWLWLTTGALVLAVLAPAAAETVYSDGWVPPRLVDGVWVTSGIDDQQARDIITRAEEKAAQEAYWQALHTDAWGYETVDLIEAPLPTASQQYWMQQWQVGLAVEANPPYYTPGIYNDTSGLHYRNDLGQRIGLDSFGQFYRSAIPGSRMDRVIQGAIEGTLPKVPGRSVWTWKNGQWIRLK